MAKNAPVVSDPKKFPEGLPLPPSALLTTRMAPLLREIRKGQVMHARVAIIDKTAAVLLSRRAIDASQGKLLNAALGKTAGVAHLWGECRFEQEAHTFVLQKVVAGLAKLLRTALLEQTGQRLPVRVRGIDPTQIDSAGTLEDAETVSPTPDAAGAQHAASEPPLDPSGIVAPVPAAASAAARLVALLEGHLLALKPRIRRAMAASADQGAIVGLRKRLRQSLRDGDTTRSQTLLKALALQLVDAGVAPAQLQRARLQWVTTRALLRQRLRLLEAKTLEFFAGQPEFSEAQLAVRRMDEVLAELDDDLVDTLDEALNESDPARRREIQAEARRCIEDYLHFVRTSTLVADLDANPFIPTNILDTVVRSAALLQAELG